MKLALTAFLLVLAFAICQSTILATQVHLLRRQTRLKTLSSASLPRAHNGPMRMGELRPSQWKIFLLSRPTTLRFLNSTAVTSGTRGTVDKFQGQEAPDCDLFYGDIESCRCSSWNGIPLQLKSL